MEYSTIAPELAAKIGKAHPHLRVLVEDLEAVASAEERFQKAQRLAHHAVLSARLTASRDVPLTKGDLGELARLAQGGGR